MNCAWIGTSEIIPFDSIECVVFDVISCINVAEILLQSSKETVRVTGDDCDKFRDKYVEYLDHISKALNYIGDE